MKIIKKIVPLVLIVAVAGYVGYFKFFGVDAQYAKAADLLIENVEKGEMKYSYINNASADKNITHKYDGENIHRYDNGELYESYPPGSGEYSSQQGASLSFAQSASNINEISKDVEIVENLNIEFNGLTAEDLSGEWYTVTYKGGCQSGSCKRRGVAGTEEYTVHLKVDGTGFIKSNRAIIFEK